MRTFPVLATLTLASTLSWAGCDCASSHTRGNADGALPDAGARDVVADDPPMPPDVGTGDVPLPPDCEGWSLVNTPAVRMTLMESLSVHTERSARILVELEYGGCEERAMPVVSYDLTVPSLTIAMRAFVPSHAACPPVVRTVWRPVTVRFPSFPVSPRVVPWRIRDGATGTEMLTVLVAPSPLGMCGARPDGSCDMDCDCPVAGQVCLSGTGLGGPFAQCAWPCELNQDCPAGQCVSVPDSLGFACMDTRPQCDARTPCTDGYRCEASLCVPDFVLNGTTRTACRCDADCGAPLRCVRHQDGTSRCEIICPTGPAAYEWPAGPPRATRWCQGPHVCDGRVAMDVPPNAAVCSWIGE